MSTTHSPGPWRYMGLSNGQTAFVTAANGKDLVAEVSAAGFTSPETFIPIRDANARLVAAAPELLAALQNAEEFDLRGGRLGVRQDDWVEQRDAIRAQVRAAIAKATGESEAVNG